MSNRVGRARGSLASGAGEGLAPVLVSVAVFGLLALSVGNDPARGVTFSNAPFTDEGWNLLNARNFAVLGKWSTSATDWARQFITLPYSLVHAGVFAATGPGIVQARLVEVSATAATAGLIVLGLQRLTSLGPALLGGIAFGSSTLVLYYGRLALVEPIVALFLTGAAVLLTWRGDRDLLAGASAGLAFAAAIASKLLAVPFVVGMLLGVSAVGLRDRTARIRSGSALAALTLAAVAWLVVVALPREARVAVMLRSLPDETLPATVGDAIAKVVAYARSGDEFVERTAPLLLAGMLGAVASLVRRPAQPRAWLLVAISFSWAFAGIGLLALVRYAPNRYVLPVLPALAFLLGTGADAVRYLLPGSARIRAAALGILAVVLAAPGSAAYAAWLSASHSTLPAAQAMVAETVPAGATLAGDYAPLFGMRTSGATIFTGFGANEEDLYATRDVRWLLLERDEVPAWVSLHPEEWALRRIVTELEWGGHRLRLLVLP